MARASQLSHTVEKRFFQGDYQGALAHSLDHLDPSWTARELPFILGALCFLGRVEEAETLLGDRGPGLSAELRVQCRFFLGIGLTRKSNYSRARACFAANLRDLRGPAPSLRARFFAFQGAAFYRYFCGKWRLALRDAERAFEAAVRADFLYGKSLSSDLRGHLLIQMGQAPLGLRMLGDAQALAHRMGNRGVAEAIELARVGYEAQLGLAPREALARLERRVKRASAVQDTYSRANLLLELARQQGLRGLFAEALGTLDQASHQIYSSQNRRQEVTLSLRYAYLSLLAGDPARGLSFIRSGKRALDPAVDHVLELALLGLEERLVAALGLEARSQELREQWTAKSRVYGGTHNQRVLSRLEGARRGSRAARTRGLGDPLGDLRDSLLESRDTAVERVLDSGYLAFLLEILPEARGGEWICLDLGEGTLTLLDRDGIGHSPGLTPLLRQLLLALAQGDQSKSQLIRSLWKYPSYHPLKHNPVIYQAITALRKLLGSRADWIQTTEGGYRLKPGVSLRSFRSRALASTVEPVPAPVVREPLNHRQLAWMRSAKRKEFFSVHDYRKMFKTTEITASRDLSALHRLGVLTRLGRARATRYTFAKERILE